MMKFNFECCNYSTYDKSNFNKHENSKKHKLVESKLVVNLKSTQSQHLVNIESTLSQPKVNLQLLQNQQYYLNVNIVSRNLNLNNQCIDT